MLQKAQAGLEKAKANYANATNISERRQKLVQSSSASVESAETAKTVQDAALADVNLATSDVAVARAAIGDAKAQLQLETATLDFHTLAAPYDAMVTARLKELGSALGAGEPVFTLIDPKSVWVLAYIDESKAGEIAVGEPAEIVLRSQPDAPHRRQGRADRAGKRSRQRGAARRHRVRAIPANFNLGEQAEVYITTVHLTDSRCWCRRPRSSGLAKTRARSGRSRTAHLQQHAVTLGHRSARRPLRNHRRRAGQAPPS